MEPTPDLVVVSPDRWTDGASRARDVAERWAERHAGATSGGARAWFVEEPLTVPGATGRLLRQERYGTVTVLRLEVPPDAGAARAGQGAHDLHDTWTSAVGAVLGAARFARSAEGAAPPAQVWLATPSGLDLVRALHRGRLVVDVGGDDDGPATGWAGDAPPALRLRALYALKDADDVVAATPAAVAAVRSRRPDAVLLPRPGTGPDPLVPPAPPPPADSPATSDDAPPRAHARGAAHRSADICGGTGNTRPR